LKNLVKNRVFIDRPSFWYTNDLEWHPEKHAGLYVMDNKVGSTGGQDDALNLGLFGCVVNTHKNYSKRSEFGTFTVHHGCIDITKIKQIKKRQNKQYDKDVQDMIIEHDPRVKHDPTNSDALLIKTGPNEFRPLTPEEIFNYLNTLFGKGVDKKVYPPHTRQLEIIKGRQDFVKQHQTSDLIVNIESLHTRFGKDKTNYLAIQPETEIIFDFAGFFATFQITSEFDPDLDQEVETRGRGSEDILKDIIQARTDSKRVWVLISTYNDEESDRISLIKLFKNANIEFLIDEVDYQAWAQIELIKKALENAIS
jgi:hypothetical protein